MTDTSQTRVRDPERISSRAADWLACGGCRALLYRKRFERVAKVCPYCGWHDRLTADERVDLLLDDGSAEPVTPAPTVHDPLRFSDLAPYPARLAAARAKTGLPDAVRVVRGTVYGHRVVVAAMDFRFLGGSLGVAAGEAITAAAEEALAGRLPLLLVTASGGARMQEGVLSLMQMAKTSNAMARLDEAGLLTITLVTDPTYGGVAASFASLSDVVLAEPGARMGFAGPRVIEQTLGQTLPKGFQTAEFLVEHGLADAVPPREELRPVVAHLLAAASRPAAKPAECTADAVVRDTVRVRRAPAAQTISLARHRDRPTTLDHIGRWVDDFVELHGDRVGGDCAATVCGVGVLDGQPVVVIGHQKGHSTNDLVQRNFGMPSPAGYRKAARTMRLAAKLGIPVVTLVDTPGAHPGMDAEENGQALAIAECLRTMGSLPVPIVCVITGEGGSGGALAFAVADRVLSSANAVYSVISPEGCAAILWNDPGATGTAADALRLDAGSLLELGVVDGVVAEPPGGAHTAPDAASDLVRDAVVGALRELRGQTGEQLLRDRRARFRRYGVLGGVEEKGVPA
ncbi:acetyl-CoA carboxylase carboxyl transferase subunit alpha [Amycolatopsis rubida]|uniref:Multifunctional fusion protein n=1 Tax=Amycolatopsis rubida TaxID=112413 RepID=A0A1I5TK20_9PSEU|nr:acetyl-CoA carboxylase carboxyl transferase subunit alpha [Amycolatopsis rubida]SFP83424.1 acetyl-CoA carboxylase carboxyl transferase subunit beta [Amycolatopsis rubida]